jgi:6-phosphogluconolactonase (cycloisomerase 2 family)
VHQVLVHNDEVITCDLGNNKVWRLTRAESGSGWAVKGSIDDFEPADGPRHAVIHPNGQQLFRQVSSQG